MALLLKSVRPAARLLRPTCARAASNSNMETDEYFIFPRERPGLDYDLNWSLNGNNVTPAGDAYRLTKPRDADKLGIKAGAVPKPTAKDVPPEAGEGELDFPEFDAALAAVQQSFEQGQVLYVAEGDAPGTRTACRVITDCPTTAATAITGVLERMPKRKADVLPVTCFVSPTGADFAGFVVEQGDGKVYAEDVNVASVVLAGKKATPQAILAAVGAASTALEE